MGKEFHFDVSIAANLLTALSHPTRLQALKLLLEGERDVGTLAREMAVKQPSLSRHLGILRGLKLVSTRRDGATIYYICSVDGVRKMMVLLLRL